MKKQTLIIFFLLVVSGIYGQEQKKHYIGSHFSYGKANYPNSTISTGLSSNRKYEGKDYLTLAIDYAYRISENTEFVTGLSATLVRLDLTSSYYWGNNNSSTYDDSFPIFSIPAGLKYHFGKYFYADGGIGINYHPHKGYTWGLGGFVGLGAEYSFKSGLTLSASPRARLDILDFSVLDLSDAILTQIGFNLGIGYRF